ncbi:MAG: serine/threonine protein kinase, partial [Verrucomicrobiales bacterium]|nr:serine/threonine protein kinase [Verrucomicrobiales bacterium]
MSQSSMPPLQQCSECGAALSASEQNGLCARCLLALALPNSPVSADILATTPEAEGASSGQRPAIPPVRKFGDYELLEEIGRGGMGVVYRARQKSLDRIVAVKVLLFGSLASPEFVRRFRAEASTAGGLQHPNIVHMYEVGMQQGEHYLVMDYVEGHSLACLIKTQPLPSRRAATYLNTIAEAIEYAHQRGILHHDLKPSNVLIDRDDQPRVADFGLAKRFEVPPSIGSGAPQAGTPSLDLTITGQVLGSPNYIPPEQAAGDRGRVSRRSDVYSLGAMLYHLLTGRPPFMAESLTDTLQQVLSTEPIPPRLLNPAVPADLETICLKCLEKEPSKRYPTAQELGDELRRFLKDEPIRARPVSLAEKAWRWCGRKPVLASLSAATLLLLLTVAIGSPIATFRIRRAQQRVATHARELRLNLYAADIRTAQQAVEQNNRGQALALLRRHQPQAGSDADDLRGWEWRYLWRLCQSDEARALRGHTGQVSCLVFSPGSGLFATAGDDRVVRVWETVSFRSITNLTGFGDFIDNRALSFSPDGRLLAAKGGRQLIVWNTRDWSRLAELTSVENWNRNNAVVFSPDNQVLASRVAEGIGFWNTTTWQQQWLHRSIRSTPDQPLFFGTGRRDANFGTVIAYAREGDLIAIGDWNVLELRDARRLAVITNLVWSGSQDIHRVVGLAWSSNYLAATYRDGHLRLWDRGTWRERLTQKVHQSFALALTFSPDERLLATGGSDEAIRLWHLSEPAVEPARLEEIQQLVGHQREVNALAFAQDGRHLASASADGTVRFWDLSAPSKKRRRLLAG